MRGFLALLCVPVGLSLAKTTASELTHKLRSSADDAIWARNPVGKVVMLLKDMAKQLQADADREDELNEAMHCWCKTNDEERSKAVKDNTVKKDQLSSLREELTSKSAQLNAEIGHLQEELGKNNRALDTAIALRKKELAEFNSAQTDMISSIASLKNAQKALAMNNPAAMIQNNATVITNLREAIKKHRDILWSTFSSKDEKKHHILSMLLGHSAKDKADPKAFLQQPASGEIVGIVDGMVESFEKNLGALRKQEEESVDSHKSLKKAKETEIAAGQSMLDDKIQEVATTDERSATTGEDIEDTIKTIAADQEFVADLRERCFHHKDEYAMRVKTRQLEIDAVNKALEFLTSDEARDLFTRTFGSSKNPEGGKLGSRNLAKFEERSGKYEQAGNRGYKHGSYSDFLQLSMTQHTAPNASSKLAAIAQKTGAYWASKYWMDKKAEDAKKEAKKEAKLQKLHDKKTAPFAQKPKLAEKRNKLGLTVEQMQVRNDKMGAIAKAMDKQIDAMELQQEQDVKKKAWCVDEIQETERQLDIERRNKADVEEKMELLEQRMKELEAEIKELKKEQDEQNSELGMAAHDRKKANKEYQTVVGDQQATEKLLKQALSVLEAVYKNKAKKASLIRQKYVAKADQARVQNSLLRAATSVFGGDNAVAGVDLDFAHAQKAAVISEKYESAADRHKRGQALALKLPKNTHAAWKVVAVPHKKPNAWLAALNTGTKLGYEPPPPPPSTGFAAHTTNRQSGGVTLMIQNLISDAQAMIAEAVKGEGDALIAYEAYVADWNEGTEARQKAIVNRQMEHARLEKDFVQAEAVHKDIVEEIARLRQYDIDLYGVQGCQFLLKNYAVRYVARMEEINALKVAKVVLTSGGGGGGGEAAPPPAELLSKNKGSMYTSAVPKLPAKHGIEHENAKPKAVEHKYGGYPDVRA